MTVCTEYVLYQLNTKAFNESKMRFNLLRKCSVNQRMILLVEGEMLVKPLHKVASTLILINKTTG